MGDGIPSPGREHEMRKVPKLVCPASNLPALRTTMDNGVDMVCIELRDAASARNFLGLSFDMRSAREDVAYARVCGHNALIATNTFTQAGQVARWYAAVGTVTELDADAVVIADPAVMAYVAERCPNLRLHMSMQGSATNYEAINTTKGLFGVCRVVLPCISAMDQVRHVIDHTDVEAEVSGLDSLCVMVEGRCISSSYAMGESPNMQGVYSPVRAVCWGQLPDCTNVRLNQVLINRYKPDEPAGYPTLCKDRFGTDDEIYCVLEEPTNLNVLGMSLEFVRIDVSAVKIEGHQRSPMYTTQVTKSLHQALNVATAGPTHLRVNPAWNNTLNKVSEGHQTTLGAYSRPWK